MISKQLQALTIDDIRQYFLCWQVEADAEQAVKIEVSDSLDKIHRMLGYLPSQSGRILQIGSSPFFLSSLLSRFGNYQLHLSD